jgi:hypothetical protein
MPPWMHRRAADRFWEKVHGGDHVECWEWVGSHDGTGYGQFWDGSRNVPAHRWAYEHLIADIPAGLYLDHLCRNRGCVNPWHVEPVTHLVNVRRGEKANRTHCPQGHPYSPENTYRHPRGDRQCRECLRVRNREARRRRAALRRAA